MSFRIAFKSLLVGLFFGVITTVAAALIFTGIGGLVPRQVLIYGVIAAIIGFVVNFLILNKVSKNTEPPIKAYPVSKVEEDVTPEEKEESKLLIQ